MILEPNNQTNPKLLSPLTLAFIGDAVFELLVREKLCTVNRSADNLHKLSIKMVCADAQSQCYEKIEPHLSEQEITILKRGRNAKTTHCPKNAKPSTYRRATGVETLFGYLYLDGQIARISQLFNMVTEQEDKPLCED